MTGTGSAARVVSLAPLRTSELFRNIEPRLLSNVLARSQTIPFGASRKILREGQVADAVYFLLNGGIRIYHAGPNEGEIVVRLMRGPAFFGEAEVFLKWTWRETVETVLPSDVLVMPAAAFLDLYENSLEFACRLGRDVSERLLKTSEHVRLFAFATAEGRLASIMLDFAEMFGTKDVKGSIIIDTRLSQTSLAASISTSRRGVNEIFKRWISEGKIGKVGPRYAIRDLDCFRAMGRSVMGHGL